MFLGKVIGTVWSTVKWPQVQGLKLLLVRPYHLADLAAKSAEAGSASPPASAGNLTGDLARDSAGEKACAAEAVVCVDLLDAGVGDDVVVAFGHAARVAAEAADAAEATNRQAAAKALAKSTKSTTKPIDAAVVAIVDSIAVTRPST